MNFLIALFCVEAATLSLLQAAETPAAPPPVSTDSQKTVEIPKVADIQEAAAPAEDVEKPVDALPPAEGAFNIEPELAPKPPSEAAIAAQVMIDAALKQIKPGVERNGNIWQITLGERSALIITDPSAERMRIMVPIIEAETVDEATLRRMMQANFDSALDARYAIAQGVIWGTFIHPLTSLTEKDFISGLAQSFKIAENFGTTYSSDIFVYGGGDSNAIFDDLLERIKELEEDTSKNTV